MGIIILWGSSVHIFYIVPRPKNPNQPRKNWSPSTFACRGIYSQCPEYTSFLSLVAHGTSWYIYANIKKLKPETLRQVQLQAAKGF
jgi:hypothetical protein